jgi:cardiolipin synthase A/B
MGIVLSWGPVVTAVYVVAVVLFLIWQDRDPTKTLAWLAIMLLLPVVGILLYIAFGRDWQARIPHTAWAKEYQAERRTVVDPIFARSATAQKRFYEQRAGTCAADVATLIERVNDDPPLPARAVEIMPTGAEKFARLKEDLAAAQRFIHLQYFIWEKDELTAELIAILMDRVAAGVEVRLTYDFFGCLTFSKSELKRLVAAGGQVSADITQISRLNYRNHRKIVVIDGEIGYTGGINVGQEYIDGGRRFATWRDTHLRITGQAVTPLQAMFAARWLEIRKEKLFDEKYFPAPEPDDPAATMVQIVGQSVADPWQSSRRVHMKAISRAVRRVWIQSPYFVPEPAIYDAMMSAALSGTDVRFMMTGQVDKRLPYLAAHSYYERLLDAGARIFQYKAGFFHAKTITVDSSICAVGTMNMDVRSLQLHMELMAWIYDEGQARFQEEVFVRDMDDCLEVTLDTVRSWGRWSRTSHSAARLLSNLL